MFPIRSLGWRDSPENEKGRSEERPFTTWQRVDSDRTDVLCLITLRARGDLELDGLTLFE